MKTGADLKQDEIELHKKLAHKYYAIREKNPHYMYFNEHWIRLYRDMLPDKEYHETLDAGCGTVEFYELITQDLNSAYTGVDLSPDMLAVGREKYKRIHLVEGDAEELPFKDNSFDLVVARGLIHHLPNPLKGSKEIYRVLKPGGQFIVSEPHSNIILYWVRKMYYRVSSHFSDSHKSFQKDEFISLLSQAGFDIKDVRYWGLLSFPFAFPDILPTYKLMPLTLFKIFVHIDTILTRMPIIQTMSWHILVRGVKKG